MLGIDENPEALAAYTLFLDTNFIISNQKQPIVFLPSIMHFNITKSDNKRYDNDEFKTFLSKLDMRYLETPQSLSVRYAKKDIDNWYKVPLRVIINRITTLENDRAEVVKEGNSLAAVTSLGAWAGSTFVKE